jgi:hypothetical protein
MHDRSRGTTLQMSPLAQLFLLDETTFANAG